MQNTNQPQPSQLVPEPASTKAWPHHKGVITAASLAILASIAIWVYLILNPAQDLGPIVVPHHATSTKTDDAIILKVSQAIQNSQLTTPLLTPGLPDECLSYELENSNSPDYYFVDVRENHSSPACKGDPNTSPLLFTVEVSKMTGDMLTDAGSTDGQFIPLAPVALSATGTASSVAPPAAPSPTQAYKISTIYKGKTNFTISQFPDVQFTLNSIIKVDGLTAGGCDSNLPQAVQAAVRVSDGCFDQSAFDPGVDYSLVGVNVMVTNNSNLEVQGDLIKLAYFEGSETQNILKFALRDIGFDSYSVAPYSNRNIQMSFWLPAKQNPAYLAYGPLTTPNQQLPFGEKLMQNFEGALKIDFAAPKVTSSK